ncbi:hypothetical protein HPT29_015665 [Microvirga terrae]|uniref:Uncharacterized protein n=1 Tax=Microvirga terrae TaxID=2740529 RepID=A0ABY5RLU2_9HYPH|nr:hypothetical protein [Microvirga terrae]UVF17953.1 hypothetical protein HPT29_015665 [Microvirga terrae]
MRYFAFAILACTILASGSVSAQERRWAPSPEGKARWAACYKETRLIFRTRNLSLPDYRAEIKDARKAHMQLCMTRATPPAPVNVATPLGQNPASALASWASSP